jgi:hypothetical protein
MSVGFWSILKLWGSRKRTSKPRNRRIAPLFLEEYEPRVMPTITHSLLDPNHLLLSWSLGGNDHPALVIVTNEYSSVVFSNWVYDSHVLLRLVPGNYQAQVATSGSPYDNDSFAVPNTSVTYSVDAQTLSWLPLGDQPAYDVVVTNNDTRQRVSHQWVSTTRVRLDLPNGSYTAQVAAPGGPYAAYSFLTLAHVLQDPNHILLQWATAGNNHPTMVTVTNEYQSITFSNWVYDSNVSLRLVPGNYQARVATSGNPYYDDRFVVPNTSVTYFANAQTLSWLPLGDQPAYDLIVTNNDTRQRVSHQWISATTVRLDVPSGSYTAQVAAPGAPYAAQSFSASDSTYLAPGHGIARWTSVPGVTAYRVEILNSSNNLIFSNWVYGTSIEINNAADYYTVRLAPAGQGTFSFDVNLEDFTHKTYAPIAPIGLTDRQTLTFTWFPVRGAVNYFFQLRNTAGVILVGAWTYTEWTATVQPGAYEWRVIPLNERNEQANQTAWTPVTVTSNAPRRADILGVSPISSAPAQLASFNLPTAAITAADGTVYIAESGSSAIKRVQNGQVDLYAGTLVAGYNGDGFRTSVMLNRPSDLAFDANNNLLVLDTFNYLLRKIDVRTGMVTTIAGIPGLAQLPHDGDRALNGPIGYANVLRFDSHGNLYMPMHLRDAQGPPFNSSLWYLSPDGIIHRRPLAFPGDRQMNDVLVADTYLDVLSGPTLFRFSNSGEVRSADLPTPWGVGLVYRPDTNTTLVGSHTSIFEFDANLNRTTFAVGFANVASISRTVAGLRVVDSDRGVIFEYGFDGRPIPGRTIGNTSAEGTGTLVAVARYDADTLLWLDNKKGYVYAYSISTGRTTVFLGNGRLEWARVGVYESATGFYYPSAIAVDSSKNIYIAEQNRIIRIGVDGFTSLFAGDVASGDSGEGGLAVNARFRSIDGIAFDSLDNLYVADTYNNKVKRIDRNGIVITVAGNGIPAIGQFGTPASNTSLNHPIGVLPLTDGSVLVADSWNNMVVKIEANGRLTHVAGVPNYAIYQGYGSYSGDGGAATAANLNTPSALALADDGTLYISDTFNYRVRAVDPAGRIRTVLGDGRLGYAADGSVLSYPSGILVNQGVLYLADSGNSLASRFRLS